MKIQVTQKHIDRGVRNSSSMCPVALALSDATGMSCHVSSHHIACGDTRIYRKDMPDGLPTRVGVFDAFGVIIPFEFEFVSYSHDMEP